MTTNDIQSDHRSAEEIIESIRLIYLNNPFLKHLTVDSRLSRARSAAHSSSLAFVSGSPSEEQLLHFSSSCLSMEIALAGGLAS